MAGRAREGWRCWLFCVLALLHSSSLALRPTPLRAAPRALHRAWAPCAVATVKATDHPLEAIRAAPANADSLESASVAGPLNDAPWRHAFRALAADPAFVSAGFGKAAFKLDERWDFAVGSVTMEDIERDVTLMPPQFVASGVRYQGGIYNQPFTAGFTFADVDSRMDEATVITLPLPLPLRLRLRLRLRLPPSPKPQAFDTRSPNAAPNATPKGLSRPSPGGAAQRGLPHPQARGDLPRHARGDAPAHLDECHPNPTLTLTLVLTLTACPSG